MLTIHELVQETRFQTSISSMGTSTSLGLETGVEKFRGGINLNLNGYSFDISGCLSLYHYLKTKHDSVKPYGFISIESGIKRTSCCSCLACHTANENVPVATPMTALVIGGCIGTGLQVKERYEVQIGYNFAIYSRKLAGDSLDGEDDVCFGKASKFGHLNKADKSHSEPTIVGMKLMCLDRINISVKGVISTKTKSAESIVMEKVANRVKSTAKKVAEKGGQAKVGAKKAINKRTRG